MLKRIRSRETALKAKELRWFKAARSLCSTFPVGEPEQPHAPAPDIRFPHLDLGIEITEYLSKQKGGSPRRELESRRDKIIAEAMRLFETASDAKLFVSVFWTPERKPPREARDSLVKGIVSVVSDLLAQERASWRTPWRPDWEKSSDRILGQYLGEIWISRASGPSSWVCADGGAVGGDVQRAQAAINGKELHVAQYRSICGNVWLLIVAEIPISSYFSPDEDFDGAIFSTSFDRVFILDVFRNRVRELALKPV